MKIGRNAIGFVAVLAVSIFTVFMLTRRDAGQNYSVRAVTIPLEGDIQTLDPATLSDPVTSRCVWQIFESLIGLDGENNIVPMLAESWKSLDGGKTWTFKLRDGVYFHAHPAFTGTGHTRAVSANDVVWSIERLARGFGSFVFGALVDGFDDFVKGAATEIKGIVASGEKEITFTLTRADPSFIYRITSPYLSIMPREVVEANPEAFGRSVAIGTGPFQLVRAGTTEVELLRNSNYWRKTGGNIDRVIFRVEKNPQFRITGLRAGTYDFVEVPAELRREFLKDGRLDARYSSDFRLFLSNTFNTHLLALDVRQITDSSLRRAISLAVDRNALASQLLGGGATSATGPIPPGMQGYHSPVTSVMNRDAARRELAKSSYRGEVLRFTIANFHSDAGQLVQDDLLQCGIKTQIEQVDFNTLVTQLFGPNRPPLLMTYVEWIYSAPEILMDQFRSTATPNPNVFGYSNAQVDALIAKFATTGERSELNELCSQIETIIANDPPAAWLYHETHAYLARKHLSNFLVTGNNHWLLGEMRSEP